MEVFEQNFCSNAQIEISINWCMNDERVDIIMNVHKNIIDIVAQRRFWVFSVITMQRQVKKGLVRRAAGCYVPPQEADSVS